MKLDEQLLIPLVLVAFAAFWAAICLLLSTFSGWRLLAGKYPMALPVEGQRWRFQSVGMRRFLGTNYGSCVTVVANDEGFGLSVMWLFRAGHPSLFVPWSDVSMSHVRQFFFFSFVRFEFTQEPGVSLLIYPRLARKIQAEIGQDWFQTAQ